VFISSTAAKRKACAYFQFLATDNAEALEGYRYANFHLNLTRRRAVQATLNHLAERDARLLSASLPSSSNRARSELDRSGFIDRLYAGKSDHGSGPEKYLRLLISVFLNHRLGTFEIALHFIGLCHQLMRTSSFPRARSATGLRSGRLE
jgi:hypothetical protein